MNKEQERALAMLAANRSRDLYEGCDGFYYVTYSADEGSPKLTRQEVAAMFAAGKISRKFPDYTDCYVLPGNEWKKNQKP
jgi:hypothetical protein